MTCKHPGGASNPACSSHPDHPENPANRRYERKVEQNTPDSENYKVVQFARFGAHVVMKVLFPNCSKCSYEGNKIMVFLNVTEGDLIQWRKIDPHFRDPKKLRSAHEAPGPAARFPASPEGWDDACEYAKRKATQGGR